MADGNGRIKYEALLDQGISKEKAVYGQSS